MVTTIYVRVSKNLIRLRNISTQQEITVTPESPFTTVRMLIGEFIPFESCIKKGLSQVMKKSIFSLPPMIIVHATEMNEGGLCEIEKRILKEALLGAGARKAVVYEGAQLSDQQAESLAK